MATNQFLDFSIVLYEYPTQDLLLLLGVENYAFIEHSFDTYSQEDFNSYLLRNDNNLPPWVVGDLKKVHYHLFVHLRKKKTIAGVFNIIDKWNDKATQSFLVLNLTNVPNFIRYLTHCDNLEKYQYSSSDIICNFNIQPYFALNLTDSDFITTIFELKENGVITTFKDLVTFAIDNGKLDLILKRTYFFKMLLESY